MIQFSPFDKNGHIIRTNLFDDKKEEGEANKRDNDGGGNRENLESDAKRV